MRLPRLTFAGLWTFIAVALPVLGATLVPMSTIDLAYQVRAGDLMLSARDVLRTDPFTFTAAGAPWVDQQWGAQVLFAAVYAIGGWVLLSILRSILVGASFALLLAACRSAGAEPRAAAGLTLGAFVVALPSLALRPQLLGILLFAVTLQLLARRDRAPRATWLIPVIVVAWANIHGSFLLGPAAVGAAWLSDIVARRPGARGLLAVGLTSLVTTVINPFGIDAWTYALGLTTNPSIERLATEWQRTSPVSVTGAVFYFSVVAVAALLLLARRQQSLPRWPELAWLAGLALLGAYAERGIAWWAIGAPVAVAPIVARLAASSVQSSAARPERASAANASLAGLLGVAIVLLQPAWRPADPMAGPTGLLTDAPVGIARALREVAGPTDRVFAPQRWGSWLEWAAPGIPVMVDSRIEVIPESAWADYLSIAAAEPGWEALLDRWGVTVAAVDSRDTAVLQSALTATSDWIVVDEETDGTVLVRSRGRLGADPPR